MNRKKTIVAKVSLEQTKDSIEESETVGGQVISNSLTGYLLMRVLYIVMMLTVLASTYNKAKIIAIIALIGLILIIKDNYKIYLDLAKKDGLSISGTIINAFTQSSFNAWGEMSFLEDFDYLLEIETDDGNNLRCASKLVALLQGDRIELAYVTKRTRLLLYCYKPLVQTNIEATSEIKE